MTDENVNTTKSFTNAGTADPIVDDVDKSSSDSSDDKEQEPARRDMLGNKEVAAYSLGHVNNDLCAAMWFIYLSWFVKNVVGLNGTFTGVAMFSGQITDGITTPIVGVASDRCKCPGGRRNFWYIFGFTFVNACFLGIWMNPGFLKTEKAKNIWYTIMPALFNVGWASVQIAHMSIVNTLTYSQRRRDKLINYRNGFTYIASVAVLVLALIVFLTVDNQTTQFRIMSLIAVGIGVCTSIYYIMIIREVKLSRGALELESEYKGQPINAEGTGLVSDGDQKKGKSYGQWCSEG